MFNQLKTKLPDALKWQIGQIIFTPVSLFALYNLLFPAKHHIEMKQAYVPGDLLVLGTFTAAASPLPPPPKP